VIAVECGFIVVKFGVIVVECGLIAVEFADMKIKHLFFGVVFGVIAVCS